MHHLAAISLLWIKNKKGRGREGELSSGLSVPAKSQNPPALLGPGDPRSQTLPFPSQPHPWHQGIKRGEAHSLGSYSFREVTRGMWKS